MSDLILNTSPFLQPLNYSGRSVSEQAYIDALISVGSSYIERYCNRVFPVADYTDELLDGTGWDSIFVKNPPINDLTDIDITYTFEDGSTSTTTYDATRFTYKPKTGEIQFNPNTFDYVGGVFTEGFQNIAITYNGGFSPVPQEIQLLVAQFVIERFDPSSLVENIEREKIGDYFYAHGQEYFKRLVASNKSLLNSYKITRV